MSYYDKDYTTLSNYKQMYQSLKCTDFRVTVKNKVFRVHKFVLCAQNTFFSDLFSQRPQCNDFQTTEVDPAAFEVFLQFLYTGRVETSEINRQLLQIAHKFAAHVLEEICVEVLLMEMNESNAVNNLILAIECNCEQIKDCACEIIAANYEKLSTSSEFKKVLLNQQATMAVLNRLGFFVYSFL